MTPAERLNQHIEQGTLIRNQWSGTDAQGRKTACLLAAMVPQCGIDGSSAACPATVMPSWLARLTPNLDDRGSLAAWPGMVRRFAALAAEWHRLDAVAWQRVQFRFLAAAVAEARAHTTDVSVHEVCDTVIALCDDVVRTGAISKAEAAEAAARAVWAEARAAAAWAVWAAWAEAAEAAAAWAAWAAAAWAFQPAEAETAVWAEAAWAVWAETAAEAETAVWDRLTVALFDAIELEL